mmetsp:Transcript_1983/g.3523  ORF Transcript_1983/g.3523 Transcript_1983/m.3523 type:complete len:234 (-) Transcript_1983:579-1280(-)
MGMNRHQHMGTIIPNQHTTMHRTQATHRLLHGLVVGILINLLPLLVDPQFLQQLHRGEDTGMLRIHLLRIPLTSGTIIKNDRVEILRCLLETGEKEVPRKRARTTEGRRRAKTRVHQERVRSIVKMARKNRKIQKIQNVPERSRVRENGIKTKEKRRNDEDAGVIAMKARVTRNLRRAATTVGSQRSPLPKVRRTRRRSGHQSLENHRVPNLQVPQKLQVSLRVFNARMLLQE